MKKKGCPPSPIIEWRRQALGDLEEIARLRDELLKESDAAQIEREYQDARERLISAQYDRQKWNAIFEITPLLEQEKRADKADERAALIRTKPTTPAGSAALIRCVLDHELKDNCNQEWILRALTTCASTLTKMKAVAA